MSRACPACLKTNPLEAQYCYYDGRALSKDGGDGPMHVGTMPFAIPFYFADGQVCVNFNQLALTCDERWDEARSLLATGYWPTFFGNIGRLDLAATAKQAASQADLDLGLSQLLEKLPADPNALRLPKVAVDSTEKHLGQLTCGTDRVFELTVINQGMLVLRGMVASSCDWMVFGNRSGPSQKMFQTRNVCTIGVRVLGNKLRAGRRPLEGEIVIDTNGGTITLPVRADVPIVPFPKGVYANDALAGATTPHEIALKAKQFATDAAILFEQGAVKAWYASNGWTYPIEGSEGSGKGAVQQFFEALGLTRPPRLEINTVSLLFNGSIGQRLSKRVAISTPELKPVYAQAWSDQPWVTFGPIKYLGNKVKIPIEIQVPDYPGQTVIAQVTIQGNGKQQFCVPVSVAIEDAPAVEEVTAIDEPPADGVIGNIESFLRNLFGGK